MTTLDEVLEHHGIKGMKWGQRRPTSMLRTGKVVPPPKPVPKSEKGSRKDLAKSLVAVGATIAAGLLLEHGDKILSSIERKTAPRSSTPGLSSTPAQTKFAKKTRGGVHKITTLK